MVAQLSAAHPPPFLPTLLLLPAKWIYRAQSSQSSVSKAGNTSWGGKGQVSLFVVQRKIEKPRESFVLTATGYRH